MQRAQDAIVTCLMVMQPRPGPESERGLLTPGQLQQLLWQLRRLLLKVVGVLVGLTIIIRHVEPIPLMILKVAEVVGGRGDSDPRRRKFIIGRVASLIAQI